MISKIKFLLKDIFKDYPLRFLLAVKFVLLSGLLEGLALTAILPLLSSLNNQTWNKSDQTTGNLNFVIEEVIRFSGLPDGPIGIVILIVLLIVFSGICFLTQARLLAKLQVTYVVNWQIRLFENILNTGPVLLEQVRSGDLMAALINEAGRISGAFYHLCIVLASILNLIIFSIIAFFISIEVTIAILGLGLLLIVITRPFLVRAYRYGQGITQTQAEIQTVSSEFIGQLKSVKIATAEHLAIEKFSTVAKHLGDLNFRNAFDIQKARAIFEFGGAIGVSVVIIIGSLGFDLAITTVLVVLALFVRLLPRITALQQGVQALNTLLPSVQKVTELNCLANELSKGNSKTPDRNRDSLCVPEIVFSKVNVSKGNKRILKNVDLKFPAGKITALVGLSGSGKSTIADVITAITPYQSGDVMVNGVNFQDLNVSNWRKSIGYVGQEAALFSDTINYNLSFGGFVSDTDLKKAITLAAGEFILKLENQLETRVGEKGINLSGGERQRLGLARAFSLPRLLYIFDEATSALDSQTESRVVENISKLNKHSTIIMVAHRFSSVKYADLIYVIENGSVIESGDWDSLSRPGSSFSELKNLQENKNVS